MVHPTLSPLPRQPSASPYSPSAVSPLFPVLLLVLRQLHSATDYRRAPSPSLFVYFAPQNVPTVAHSFDLAYDWKELNGCVFCNKNSHSQTIFRLVDRFIFQGYSFLRPDSQHTGFVLDIQSHLLAKKIKNPKLLLFLIQRMPGNHN
jgi:hypothetical protein